MLVIPNGFIHRHARQYSEGKGCKDVFNACCLVCFSVTLITIGAILVIVGYTYVAPENLSGDRQPDRNLTLSGFVLLGVGLVVMVSTVSYKICSKRRNYLKEPEAHVQVEAGLPLRTLETTNTELPEIPVWLNIASPLEQHFLRPHGQRHAMAMERHRHFFGPSKLDKTVNGQLVTHSAVFGQVPKPRMY